MEHARPDWIKEGVATSDMVSKCALTEVQRLTSTKLVMSCNGGTIYIGGSAAKDIDAAKEKLTRLAVYFYFVSRCDVKEVQEVFLYNENDNSTKGEYRFLADKGDLLLKGYVLDRFFWPNTDMHYPLIFNRGVVVRSNPANEPWADAKSNSGRELSAVTRERIDEGFSAFSQANWTYRSKEPGQVITLQALDTHAHGKINGTQDKVNSRALPAPPGLDKKPGTHVPGKKCSHLSPASQVSQPLTAKQKKPSKGRPRKKRKGKKCPPETDISADKTSNATQSLTGVPSGQLVATSSKGLVKPAKGETAKGFEKDRLVPLQVSQPDRCLITEMDPEQVTTSKGVEPKGPLVAEVPNQLATGIFPEQTTPPRGSGPGKSLADGEPNQLLIDLDLEPVTPSKEAEPNNPLEIKEPKRLIHMGNPSVDDTADAEHPTSTVESQTPASSAYDPFAQLWEAFRSSLAHVPRLAQNDERESRSFHTTMRQKTASRAMARNVFPDFHPDMMVSIKKSLRTLMAPLPMLPGRIDVRVELGRFCFLNVKKSQVQKPDESDEEKHYPLDRILQKLNKRHQSNHNIYFTQIMTCFGADANYICHLNGDDGKSMWHRSLTGRSSVYEFICRTTVKGEDFNFIVDIDAMKFTTHIRHFRPDQSCFAVHCTKRAWDFRLVLSTSEDLDRVCGRFAVDLLSSLRVTPGKDILPELEVSYDSVYNVEILAVRTRNTACCTSQPPAGTSPSPRGQAQKDVQELHVTEVWEMDRLEKSDDSQQVQLRFARYKDRKVHSRDPVKWYEVSLKSEKISAALAQNMNLELGKEANWKVDELVNSGAVDGLVAKAAELVKKLDGVGYWNDNQQGELLQSVAPGQKPKKGQDLKKFW
ncbi:hypothetical protein GGS20DRAFT_459292 [Poronia punctata]|nr:hypothetical protein GGS20DRAFT_459292 [Poronia punctata]